jgi:hypothetical protein
MSVTVTGLMMVVVMLAVITSVVVPIVVGLIHQGNLMAEAAVTLSREFPICAKFSSSRG